MGWKLGLRSTGSGKFTPPIPFHLIQRAPKYLTYFSFTLLYTNVAYPEVRVMHSATRFKLFRVTCVLITQQIHLASCIYKFVSCTNEDCKMRVPKKDLEEHVTKICLWRTEQCAHCQELHRQCQIEVTEPVKPFGYLFCGQLSNLRTKLVNKLLHIACQFFCYLVCFGIKSSIIVSIVTW